MSTQASRKSSSGSSKDSKEQSSQKQQIISFIVIDDLQNVGVNVSEIKKLKDAGLMTVGQVLQQSQGFLVDIKGLTDARIDKIRDACRKLMPNTNFRTGLEVRQHRKAIINISTGSSSLDSILGGGIETGQITEVFGEFRTGKTQLAHTLCVTSQLSFESGGGEGKIIYIDTEGNFRPQRIEQISERYGLDADMTLENIIHCRGPYRVLIIDSIISLFRVEFSGRGELSERQQKLGQHLSHLEKIAEEFNIVPVGGHVLAHASTTRVFLKKGKGEQRIAKIYDSPLMPEAEATFQITPGGVADVA
eukprot:GSChrysophyteH1.ASY1.ANO1.616.1 assembled CDS